MEKFLNLTKLVVLSYCTYEAYICKVKNIYEIILFILAYICLNTTIYLVKKSLLEVITLSLSAVIIILVYFNTNSIFILLLPLNIFEISVKLIRNFKIAAVVPGIPVFFINANAKVEYLFIGFLSCTIYVLLKSYSIRKFDLLKENDALRKKVYNTSIKLDKNLEYKKQIKYLSKLEERNKISQEIHDKIGHTIAGSLIQIEAAKLFLNNDTEKSKEILDKVTNILRVSNEEIRLSLKNIKPPLEQMGLNRIKLTLDEFSVNNDIKSNLIYTGLIEKVSHMQWRVIYDNLGEALTNVLKYSKATKVTVKIDVFNKFIKFEIKDNGIGAENIKKSLGIKGMEERCSNLHGKVIVDGSNGFSVINILPFEEVLKNGN